MLNEREALYYVALVACKLLCEAELGCLFIGEGGNFNFLIGSRCWNYENAPKRFGHKSLRRSIWLGWRRGNVSETLTSSDQVHYMYALHSVPAAV